MRPVFNMSSSSFQLSMQSALMQITRVKLARQPTIFAASTRVPAALRKALLPPTLVLVLSLLVPALTPVQAQTPAQQVPAGIAATHRQLLDQYCSECHNQEDFSGSISFDLLDADNVLNDAETWEKVLLKLEAGMMPPPGKERPDSKQVAGFIAGVAETQQRCALVASHESA
jgi:mono/diheme cytochrome c family protein